MTRVRQPLLVVQPMLDREIPGITASSSRNSRDRAPVRSERFRSGARCQSPARAGRHRRCRRIRHARAAGRQPCGHARTDLLARKTLRPPRQNRCGFWKRTIPPGEHVRFRLPAGSIKTIGRSTGAEFIVDARWSRGFTASDGNGRFSRGQGSRQHKRHVRQWEARADRGVERRRHALGGPCDCRIGRLNVTRADLAQKRIGAALRADRRLRPVARSTPSRHRRMETDLRNRTNQVA